MPGRISVVEKILSANDALAARNRAASSAPECWRST
jgi:hypothetical protein